MSIAEAADPPDVANYLPTPAEITQKAAEIRAGWSEDERRRRHIGNPDPEPKPWTVPEYSARDLSQWRTT